MDLSDLNFDAVSDILSTLSESDVENLKKMASQMFLSSDSYGEDKKEKSENEKSPFSEMPFDMESMTKVFSLMNKLKNQPEDPRIKLLWALKPMLTEKRRHRVDEAVQMLRLMTILPLLRE